MRVISALMFVLTTSLPAFAEWGMYANRDGKGFVLEKTFAFQKDCDAAARATWLAAQQKGAFGCSEYSATSFANKDRKSAPRTSADEPFGEKYRKSQQEEERWRQQKAAEWDEAQRAREVARERGREQGREFYNCIRSRGMC